jgi:hypothetical protein
VERNCKAGQNPPRVVVTIEEEEEEEEEGDIIKLEGNNRVLIQDDNAFCF